MPSTNQSCPVNQHIFVKAKDFADNNAVDVSEPITVTGANANVTIAIGDLNEATIPPSFTPNTATGRAIKIAAIGQGSATLFVSAQDVPSDKRLTINMSLSAAENLSRIEFDGALGPFPGV